MRAAHWEEIHEALKGEKPMTTTYIDEAEETWFTVMNKGLYVWSHKVLYKEPVKTPNKVCDKRCLFYHHQRSLYVELAVYGDKGVLSCAVDNGFKRQFSFDPKTIDERCEHYGNVGFVRVGPWHLAQNQSVIREYRSGNQKKIVRIDGNTLSVGNDKTTCANRQEAEALAEQEVANLLPRFEWVLIETMSAREQNPAAVVRPQRPEMKTWPEPQDAYEAVDQAMDRLEELHTLFPAANAVLELLRFPEDEARAAELVSGDFAKLRRAEVGPKPENSKNSFDYFQARYQTLNWVVRGTWNPCSLDDTFSSNYGIGAKCVMELRDATPFTEEWANDFGDPELTKELVKIRPFESDYVFDTRFTSDEGEHPIFRFDFEGWPRVPNKAPKKIKPFGFWLLERVKSKSKKLTPWLVKIQG